MSFRFDWDERKSQANRRKHGITFEEATTAFFDDNALFMGDPDHSEDEERFVLLGMSSAAKLLVVCHCYREGDEVIRVISARKANRGEQNTYRRRTP